ncbi:hypothetical protein ACFW1P_12655, partial [Paenibacillus sp. NPDC058910]|uniref:hypothetical protein n=1 Tax=Paenibacillus sp. NPDC058910 TaxID=3346670 RepID=UPI0036A1BD2A
DRYNFSVTGAHHVLFGGMTRKIIYAHSLSQYEPRLPMEDALFLDGHRARVYHMIQIRDALTFLKKTCS